MTKLYNDVENTETIYNTITQLYKTLQNDTEKKNFQKKKTQNLTKTTNATYTQLSKHYTQL